MVSGPHALEKNVYSTVVGCRKLSMSIRSYWYIMFKSLQILLSVNRQKSVTEIGMSKSPIMNMYSVFPSVK